MSDDKIKSLKTLVQTQGGFVPNYTSTGEQHYRVPFKDKSALVDGEIRPAWTRTPAHGTTAELRAARRRADLPDSSCDVDGDGAVGPTDYFVAQHFARERPNRLNTAERSEVVAALETGWLDKFSFGYEQAGAQRAYPVKQVRGQVVTVDNQTAVNEAFAPGQTNPAEPRFRTLTDLQLHRKVMSRNCANILKEQWDAHNPSMVPDPSMVAPTAVTTGSGRSGSSERPTGLRHAARRAAHAAARTAAGLDAEQSGVNPERDEMQLSVRRREKPACTTRSEMRRERNAKQLEDLQQATVHAAQHFVPHSARHTRFDAEEYEARRADPEAMTLSRLRERRRCDFIEYNMAHCSVPVKEYPRHSDQDAPWWKAQGGFTPDPPRCLLKEMRALPEALTPKVTEVSLHRLQTRDEGDVTFPAAGHPSQLEEAVRKVPIPHGELGQTTIKRWTTEFVPAGRAVPRLFDKLDGVVDGVKQAPEYAQDCEPLPAFFSVAAARNKPAGKEHHHGQQLVAHAAESDLARAAVEGADPTTAVSSHPPTALVGVTSQASLASSRDSARHTPVVSRARVPDVPLFKQAPPQGALSGGRLCSDDPPMTARLDRLAACTVRTTAAEGTAPATPTLLGPNAVQAPECAPPAALRPARLAAGLTGPTPTPAPAPAVTLVQPHAPPPIAVRSSGFQWLKQRAMLHHEERSLPVGFNGPGLGLGATQSSRTPRSSSRSLAEAGQASQASQAASAQAAPAPAALAQTNSRTHR